MLNLESKASRTLLTDKEIFAGGPSHHFLWSPDSKWLLFDYSIPGIAPGEVGLVRADGKGTPTNLTLSGFNDDRAKWILGGKAMLWFSNRDGLKSVAQGGSAQRDVYAMFFTKEAWDRFRLTKEEYALVKEAEEKKDKDKPKADADKDKKDAAKDAKVEDLVIDFDGLDIRKARLTIHSSSLSDALVSKDGETLYYLARFEKNANLWSTNLRTQGNEDAGHAQRQRRQHGVGQGPEEHLPAGRRHDLEDRPGRRQARDRQLQQRGRRRHRGRARGDVRSRLAAHARHVLLGRLPRRRLGRRSAPSTRSTCRTSATTTSSPRCSARCSAS